LLVLVTVLVVLVVLGVVLYAKRGVPTTVAAVSEDQPLFASRPLPEVQDFHVGGDTATVQFSVPLGDTGPSGHLVDLLSAAAVEHVRGLVRDGLPLEDVTRIAVLAMRSGASATVTTIELPSTGVLPEANTAVLAESASDPIAAVQAIVADANVAASTGGSTSIEALSEFISLSVETESHLRSLGVDPAEMKLDDMVLGLLRSEAYNVALSTSRLSQSLEGTADVYDISNKGQKNLLVILPHIPDSHPELDDSVLALLAVEVAQSKVAHVILVTDKYSPYAMYEREKREKRLVWVTRERLQAFVDSFDEM